ncbi:MAG: O-antigen ligase family protein [Clostridium sp.]|nr:O-antigen ligase family protein [Clostridium sp.]
MSEKLKSLKALYRENPGWCWLIAIIFFFPILPEYVSPFLLFIGFIVFKLQWSREGKKAKVGTLGKLIMGFMALALVSTIWSDTRFSTLATAGLWWGMFLIEVMIYNLAVSRKKIDRILSTMVLAGGINGLIGALQIVSYTLFRFNKISEKWVFVTPFYKGLDKAIYSWLPFDIRTNTWSSRASGFFSNPNLFATYMIIVYPISIYLFLNSKDRKHRLAYFILNILISAGMSSTMTRAGCFIAIGGWVFMFIILAKRHWKPLLQIFIPTICIILPSILTRYGIIFKTVGQVSGNGQAGMEARESSAAHFQIWQSLIDFVTHSKNALIYGTGFGVEKTRQILVNDYNLNKPHAHNFIIETWVELGVIGVILLAIVLFCAFGKLLEINANNGKKFTLVFCVFTSMMTYLLFGLTDYIFNSPKQIIFLFIFLGLTQAISRCYEKTIIHDPESLLHVAEMDIQNILHQKPIQKKK